MIDIISPLWLLFPCQAVQAFGERWFPDVYSWHTVIWGWQVEFMPRASWGQSRGALGWTMCRTESVIN